MHSFQKVYIFTIILFYYWIGKIENTKRKKEKVVRKMDARGKKKKEEIEGR